MTTTEAATSGMPWVAPADLKLPESFGWTAAPVDETTSPDERMPTEHFEGYLGVGRSALKTVRLAQAAARVPDFTSILDLPSGHGRVLRWLKAGYPAARLTACDLLTDGVDFCGEQFGATKVYSSYELTPEMFPDRYDLIWVGSLFTHIDVPAWDRFIEIFTELLLPNGVLVITTHGELVAERMRAGHHYGYPEQGVRRALRAYDHSGFAFLEESPTNVEYGITLSRPEWVVERLLRHRELRLVNFTEALWANHQDVVSVVKRPVVPEMANSPYT